MKDLFLNKKVILINLFIALSFTFLAWFLFADAQLPYNFKIEKQELFQHSEPTVYYHDFDKDGDSEKIRFGFSQRHNGYFIYIASDAQMVIDQITFKYTSRYDLIKFADWDGDNEDDILVFTYDDNNIYLTVSKFGVNEILFKENPILSKPSTNKLEKWLIGNLDISIENFERNRQLILMLSTGYGVYPRSVYSFDTNTLEMLGKFEVSANLNVMEVLDLDNDGEKEIYLSANATGNDKSKKGFHDFYTWLFKLDENIDLIAAKQLNGYFPSSCMIKHRNGIKTNFLSLMQTSIHSNGNNGFYLIDSELEIVKSFDMDNSKISYDLFSLLSENNDFYYVICGGENFIKLDNNFNVVLEKKVEKEIAIALDCADLLGNETEEIIIWGADYISILDNNFEPLAYIKLDDEYIERRGRAFLASLKQSGLASIGFNYNKYEYILSLVQNPFYSYRYLMLALVFLSVLSLLMLVESIFIKIFSYYKTSKHLSYSSNTPLVFFNSFSKIEFVNENFKNLFGTASLTNNTINKIINNEEIERYFNESIKQLIPTRRKITTSLNKKEFTGELVITPLLTIKNLYTKFVAEFIDHTEVLLFEREKLWSKTAQKIAHDIKTPLSVIQLNLNAIKQRLDEETLTKRNEFNDDVNMIQAEIKHITELTKSFLKFSSLEKPNFQWVKINDLVNRAVSRFAKYFDNGINFDFGIEDNLDSVWVDPNQLEQVLHIIIENSIDAVREKGEIKLTVNLSENTSTGKEILFILSDNGSGIAENCIGKIFEPYYTGKQDGTGMGLTIAKKIIEEHNGTIDIFSKINLGTTITIILPYNQEDM